MLEGEANLSLLILTIGALIFLAILVRSAFDRIGVSSLVGFIVLGLLLRLADLQWQFLSEGGGLVFDFLARIGIIILLFRVGLESKLSKLLQQLRRASVVWTGDVMLSGTLGFIVPFFLLDLPFVPSLFVASAFTATSVGVSVGVWQEAKAISSPNGEMLIDVAELDDISGIFLMAMLFGVIPVLRDGMEASVLPVLGVTALKMLLKLFAFGAFCVLFSLYLEGRITEFFREIESPPDLMLLVASIGIIMAALAGLLGLSVAIGAFFAGLVFSRDPTSVKIDASFNPLYDLLEPFFFIGIGLSINPDTLLMALGLGLALLITAILGKFIGAGATAWVMIGWPASILIGASMIPRAEIALIIMQRGLRLGEWVVPSHVFSAVVLVSTATCLGSPLIVRYMLRRWPQTE